MTAPTIILTSARRLLLPCCMTLLLLTALISFGDSGPGSLRPNAHAASVSFDGAPYSGTAAAVPGVIETEHYDNGGEGIGYHDTTPGTHGQDYTQPPPYSPPGFRQPTDVDIYKHTSYSNSYLILGQAGDWTSYTVNVSTTGSYTLQVQVAWGGADNSPGSFHVEVDGVDKTGSLQIPDTNWTFTMVSKTGVQLSAGTHLLRIVWDVNAANGYCGDIDYLNLTLNSSGNGGSPYGGTAAAVPGVIETEHYDNGGEGIGYHDTTPGTHGQDYTQPPPYSPPGFRQPTDVDIYKHTSYSNSYLVLGQAGDWTSYTINISTTGIYTLQAQVAWGGADNSPGSFHVEVDGVDKTGSLQIPDTNWTFTTVTKTGVQLNAGMHLLRIVWDVNVANDYCGDIDYLNLILVSATVPIDVVANSISRLEPMNRTGGGGEDPLSRNFNWSLPLVSLPGRVAMDLGLTLSYNSLVWTRSGNFISFDDDKGFPGPGFRLGFPVIQPLYYNSEVGKNAYLLIGTDGSRTELRQVGTSALYEAADSSHLLLDSNTMILRATDGTQLSYALYAGEYNCTQIKERNGNYLTVNYTASGRIDTVVDTLARSLKFNYDANGWLSSITQLWNQGAVTHNWARFEYANTTIHTNFPNLTVYGPADNSLVKTLSKVTLADDSHYDFSYSSWGQIWKVSSFAADNHLLNYHSYNLPQTAGTGMEQADCPRFTERHDWAQYGNGDTDGTTATNEEAVTSFAIPVSDTWTMPDNSQQSGTRAQVTLPDGTSEKLYFIGTAGTSSGWQRGLPALVNTYDSAAVLKRQVMTTWTQDNTAVSYQLNPRLTERNIYDPEGNRARTQITYQQFTFANGTSCHLPRDVYEYASNATTKLRSTRTDYNTSTAYTDRRMLGLVSETQLYEGDVNSGGALLSKVAFNYDESGSIQGTDAPVQHDNTNYAASFVSGRGNLSSVKRYDVNDISQFTTTSTRYNTAGAVVSSRDASNHDVQISYTDSFSDNISRNTLAYPTTVTDPDGYSSTSKRHFDFAGITYTRTPLPNVTTNTPGPEQTFTYDVLGRLQQVTNLVNNAYTRFEYPTNQIRFDTYTTIQEGLGEAHSFKISDGVGRVVGTATDHPGSVGGYRGQKFVYDVMGHIVKTSNPTETSASGAPSLWTTAGDDAAAGWVYTEQTYDWKGRSRVITNQDGTTKTASYSGCGCAGGEVVTLTDEGTIDASVAKRRQQKIYSDVLGRVVKTELLNWQGGTPYSMTVSSYNARDQITQVTQYAGADGSGTSQQTTLGYDGFGRLRNKHVPQQDPATSTTYSYNADDTILSMTDARGASVTYSYNNRHLVTTITYNAPAGITPTSNVTFSYDAAGNRTSMTDGLGNQSYGYNQLSQLMSESRIFTNVGNFTLNYDYNLAGELKKITDASNTTINYGYDSAGQLTGVTGSDTLVGGVSTYASGFQFRAWGGLKQVSLGTHTTSVGYNSRVQPTSFSISGVVNQSYDYYADGRLSFVHNTTDNNFDRALLYDHAGRLKRAKAGTVAHDDGADFGSFPMDETFEYDVFDNTTARGTVTWLDGYTDFASYTNQRRSGWAYDADGRVSTIDTRSYTYDAAGRNTVLTGQRWKPTGYVPTTTESGFDGDGNRVRENSGTSSLMILTYYLRSSVLGGAIVEELNSSGQKQIGYIYTPSGSVLATQFVASNFVNLKQISPLGVSQYEFNTAVGSISRVEFDPVGAAVRLNPNGPGGHAGDHGDIPEGGGGAIDGRSAAIENPAGGCVLDGVFTPCDWIARLFNSGALATESLVMDSKVIQQPEGRFKVVPFLRYERNDIVPLMLGLAAVAFPFERGDGEGLDIEERIINFTEPHSQKSVSEDDPSVLQADNNGKDCGIEVTFKPGTTYSGTSLPNGPSTVPDPKTGQASFGFGFSVTGWVGSGGVGTIGVDALGKKVTNPKNPNGRWSLEQWTNAWLGQNGQKINERATFPDLPLTEAGLKADGNQFGFYDHPGGTMWPANFSRFENHLIKVYSGKIVCEVGFHFIQHGNTIHWGRGTL